MRIAGLVPSVEDSEPGCHSRHGQTAREAPLTLSAVSFHGEGTGVTNSPTDREKAGLKVIEQLGWGENEGVRELDEDLWRIISEANFGTIWARPGLSLRERELVCMAVLIALGARGVAIHFKHAHNVGFTDAELKEVVLQTIPYAGLPRALSAMALLRKVQQGAPLEL